MMIIPKASNLFFAFLCHSPWSIFSRVHSWPAFGHLPGSQAAFGTIFRVTGSCRKARPSFLKRVNKRKDFTTCQWFHRSKQKLYCILSVLHRKTAKHFFGAIIAYIKSTVLIFRSLGKIFILWHYPFKRMLTQHEYRHKPASLSHKLTVRH